MIALAQFPLWSGVTVFNKTQNWDATKREKCLSRGVPTLGYLLFVCTANTYLMVISVPFNAVIASDEVWEDTVEGGTKLGCEGVLPPNVAVLPS